MSVLQEQAEVLETLRQHTAAIAHALLGLPAFTISLESIMHSQQELSDKLDAISQVVSDQETGLTAVIAELDALRQQTQPVSQAQLDALFDKASNIKTTVDAELAQTQAAETPPAAPTA